MFTIYEYMHVTRTRIRESIHYWFPFLASSSAFLGTLIIFGTVTAFK
jgi:hypothetical protein